MQVSVQQESYVSDRFLENLARPDVEIAVGCALAGMRRNFGSVSNLNESVQSIGVVEYNSYARAMRTLFSTHEYSAIGSFREQASLEDIHSIARIMRHPIRNLRVNSGVILANAIDNRNACVIIDQLYAPVEPSETDTPDINGRANLIYISRSLAKWSRRENWDALMAAISFIEEDLSRSSQSELANLDQTRKGLVDLKSRLDDNKSSNIERAPSFNGTNQTFYTESMSVSDRKACADFDSYEFSDNWSPSKFYSMED